jgi:hypothetical protein
MIYDAGGRNVGKVTTNPVALKLVAFAASGPRFRGPPL